MVMRLCEHHGKQLMARYQIPIPKGILVLDGESVNLRSLSFPAVVKAQVPVGRRGRAGGIKMAANLAEVNGALGHVIGMDIGGFKVEKALVEEKLDSAKEVYLGLSIDRDRRNLLLIACGSGGMDIEEVDPHQVFQRPIDPLLGLQPFEVRNLVAKLDLQRELRLQCMEVISKIYRMFVELDALLVEINPAIITRDNRLVAADARVVLDEYALFRHAEFKEVPRGTTAFEQKAIELGASAVQMDGAIGVITSGAGLGMATIDTLKFNGGSVAAIMDLGGVVFDQDHARMAECVSLMKEINPKAIFINFLFQSARCDTFAKGIVEALGKSTRDTPAVVRLKGNRSDEARAMLEQADFIVTDSFYQGCRKAIELSRN
jgi:succinyl-CoA synthetase beta subunit